MPKGSQRPYTRKQVQQKSAFKDFSTAARTQGLASDLYFARGVDKLTGRKPVRKKVQKRKK